MNTIKSFFLHPYFIGFASLCSILSVFLILFLDKTVIIITLTFLFISISGITLYGFRVLNKYLKLNYHEDFFPYSIIVKYSTEDSFFIKYDIYRHVVCKRLFKSEILHPFKWSGSKAPTKCSSNLQKFIKILPSTSTDRPEYDYALLKFNKTMLFNHTAVVHFRAELDDTDHQSKTHLGSKVTDCIDLISYRVELKYKKTQSPAHLYRRPINTCLPPEWELLTSYPFDLITKSYECHIISPEIGYFYKLEWER